MERAADMHASKSCSVPNTKHSLNKISVCFVLVARDDSANEIELLLLLLLVVEACN